MRLCFASIALVFATVAAHADTVSFALQNPNQTVASSGGTLTFNATISAPASNTGLEYLNGDSFSSGGSGLTLDDTGFFSNTPEFLSPGGSFSGTFFTLKVPSGTAANTYVGFFSVLGGPTSISTGTLGSQTFSVKVNAPLAVTPEPSSLALLGTGLTGLVAVYRRRLVA